jgi:hypothetical protein
MYILNMYLKNLRHIYLLKTHINKFLSYIYIFLIHTLFTLRIYRTYSIHIFLLHIYVLISVGCILSQPKPQSKCYLKPILVGFS